MINLTMALATEKRIKEMVRELKGSIVADTKNKNVDGIEKVNDFIGIIDFTTLINHGVWGAECYLQSVQANYIERSLNNIETVCGLISKIERMVEDKKVKVNGETCYLNDSTIEVLKNFIGGIENENL